MAKISYEIHTPHGVITRKSDREYTHAVYWPDKDGNIGYVNFCGSLRLAEQKAQGAYPGLIVPATKKGEAVPLPKSEWDKTLDQVKGMPGFRVKNNSGSAEHEQDGRRVDEARPGNGPETDTAVS